MEEYFLRISEFLSEYVNFSNGINGEKDIKKGISLLINTTTFTVEELRKEALERFLVLIPKDYIKLCEKEYKQ